MWKRIRAFLTRGNRSESKEVTLSSKKTPEDPELPEPKHRNQDNETSETEAQDVVETSTEQATENTGKREDSSFNEETEAKNRIETPGGTGAPETTGGTGVSKGTGAPETPGGTGSLKDTVAPEATEALKTPGDAGAPETPGGAGAPKDTVAPEATEALKTPGGAGVPETPGVTEDPKGTGALEAPEDAGAPETPGGAGAPKDTVAPEGTEALKTPGGAGVPETPGVTEDPKGTGALEAPEDAGAPETPGGAGAPKDTVAPEGTEALKTPGGAGVPETPGVTDDPKGTGALEAPEDAGAPETPGGAGAPKDTVAPESTGSPETPESTGAPETTRGAEAPKDTVALVCAGDPEAPGGTVAPGESGVSGAPEITSALVDNSSLRINGSITERSHEKGISSSVSRMESDPPRNPPGGYPKNIFTICFWNESCKVSWLPDYLNMYSSVMGLQLECNKISLDGEQNSLDELTHKSLFTIIYCDCSEELEKHLEQFINPAIKTHGSQRFAMIINGFDDENSMNQRREGLEKVLHPGCKLLLLTKEDTKFLQKLSGNEIRSWRRMQSKLHRFMEIISTESSSGMNSNILSQTQIKKKLSVFSWSKEKWQWFHKLLNDRFPGCELKEFIYNAKTDRKTIKNNISSCSFAIFHVTKECLTNLDFTSLFEKKKVLLVFDVVEDLNPDKFLNQSIFSRLWRAHDIQFHKEEASIRERLYEINFMAAERIHKQLSELDTSVSETVNFHKIRQEEECRGPSIVDQKTGSHRTVGIFSKSAESDYEWLQTLLQSESFKDQIQNVHSFYISNNGIMRFVEEVSQCSLGILYHTRNRGKINITDVTSSLYDEELKLMSEILERDNVLVVVDDLDDSSDKEKRRILESQPKIRRYAADLLLITEKEKENEMCLIKKLKGVKRFASEQDILT